MPAIDHVSKLGSYVIPGAAIGLLTVGFVPGADCGALLYLTDKVVNIKRVDLAPGSFLMESRNQRDQVKKVAKTLNQLASHFFTMSLAIALKVTTAPLFSFTLGITVGGIKAVQYLIEKATGKELSAILKSGLEKACSYAPCSSCMSTPRSSTYSRKDYNPDSIRV